METQEERIKRKIEAFEKIMEPEMAMNKKTGRKCQIKVAFECAGDYHWHYWQKCDNSVKRVCGYCHDKLIKDSKDSN